MITDLVRLEVQTARADIFVLGVSFLGGYRLGGPAESEDGYTPNVEWMNILNSATDLTYVRGGENGNSLGASLEAGTLEAMIRDSALDPSSNPYIRRGTPIRVQEFSGTWKTTWSGVINNVKTRYTKGLPEVRITAVDAVTLFANSYKDNAVGGTFVQRVNDVMGVVPTPHTVSGGTATFDSYVGTLSVLEHLKLAQDTELGFIYADKEGGLKAYGRGSLPTPISTPLYTFQDTVASTAFEVDYIDLDLFNDVLVKNVTVVSGENVTTEHGPYKNQTSIATNGSSRAEVETNLLTGGAVDTYGAYILSNYDAASLRVNIDQTLRVLSIEKSLQAEPNNRSTWFVTINLIDTKEG